MSEEPTDAPREPDERLFVQGEIARLDREWDLEREGLMQRTKRGQAYAPQRSQAIALGILPFLFFVVPVIVPLGERAWMVWAFSSVMALALWAACWRFYQLAVAYEAGEASYRTRRDTLVRRLESADAVS